jgi:phospholipid transport system substrate-binding protein
LAPAGGALALGALCAVFYPALVLTLGLAPAASAAQNAGSAEAPAAAKARRKSSTDAKAAAGGQAPADSSPLAELRKSNATLKKLLAKQPPTWSPETDARNSEVRKVVDQFLDFDELARRSLARHWEGLNPRQRTEFVSTLRDLVDRNYLKQIHGKPDYDLKFDSEKKDGNEGEVRATLTATTNKGKKVTVDLVYKTIYKNGHWVVYDVITDDQSLLENYRAEFNKIIEKDGFDALLKRMRRKLNEKTD